MRTLRIVDDYEVYKDKSNPKSKYISPTNDFVWTKNLHVDEISEQLTDNDGGFGFMTDDQKKWIDKHNATYPITDMIEFDRDEDDYEIEQLVDIAKSINVDDPLCLIPDIILDETLPLETLRIKMTKMEDGKRVYRIFDIRIFTDIITEYKMKALGELPLNECEKAFGLKDPSDVLKECFVIGSVTVRSNINNIPATMEICQVPILLTGDNKIVFTMMYTYFSNNLEKPIMDTPDCQKPFTVEYVINIIRGYGGSIAEALFIWYGTMVSLLCPPIRECVYGGTERVVDETKHSSSKGKKQKVKYIRRIKLIKDGFDKIYKGTNVNKRKTMLWHVCGHWVHRGNKVFFRKGYWKGPLRDSKNETNNYEPREREIM